MSEQTKYPEAQPFPARLNDAVEVGALFFDPVVEAYKKGVDRTILRENLKLSPQQRSEKFLSFMRGVSKLRETAEQNLHS